MNFELNDEHLMIKQAARDFAQNELKEGVIDRDSNCEYPEMQVKRMAELGFLGMTVSTKYGGGGMDTMSYAIAVKEISKIDNNITPFPLDVTNSEKCKEVFAQIKEKFIDIDVVLFCAGIHDPELEKDFNLENIQKIMNVNFFGVINSINSVYDYFKEKKNGHISIISSVAGYRGLPSSGAYCSSKSAITTFAESLYFDLITQYKHHLFHSLDPGFLSCF